jgi:hypothetical protein
MVISVTGMNVSGQRTNPLLGLTGTQVYMRASTGHWVASSGATQDGQASLVVLNHYGRFPEEVFVRLGFVKTTANGFGPLTDRSYRLAGQTKENGTGAPRRVRVYHRPTGRFCGELTSDLTNGSFNALLNLLNSVEYQVVALDKDDATVYNDRIVAHVIPVT